MLRLHRVRVSQGETQKAVLKLLESEGPMQVWQISQAIGRDCVTCVFSLRKRGFVEQLAHPNMHPNPCAKQFRATAPYVFFVRYPDPPKGAAKADKEAWIRQRNKQWAEKLRAAGWHVYPPKT